MPEENVPQYPNSVNNQNRANYSPETLNRIGVAVSEFLEDLSQNPEFIHPEMYLLDLPLEEQAQARECMDVVEILRKYGMND